MRRRPGRSSKRLLDAATTLRWQIAFVRLLQTLLPQTLERIVRKDLGRGGIGRERKKLGMKSL